MNFDTKTAAVELDETVLPAQGAARVMGETPHMMGKDMKYAGALLLSVAGLKDEATAKKAKDALVKIEGVNKVTVEEKEESITVEFKDKGNATAKQLIEALAKAGLKARPYEPKAGAKKPSTP